MNKIQAGEPETDLDSKPKHPLFHLPYTADTFNKGHLMKNSTLLLAFLVTVQLSNTHPTIAAPTPESEGFTRLFDGKTFKGWEGNMDHFRIKEGDRERVQAFQGVVIGRTKGNGATANFSEGNIRDLFDEFSRKQLQLRRA